MKVYAGTASKNSTLKVYIPKLLAEFLEVGAGDDVRMSADRLSGIKTLLITKANGDS